MLKLVTKPQCVATPSLEGLDLELELAESTARLQTLFGKLKEVETCASRAQEAAKFLQSTDNITSGMRALQISASMESLLDKAESAITKECALEGLSDVVKNAWEQFKTICKKIWEAIVTFFKNMLPKRVEVVEKKIEEVETQEKQKIKYFNPRHKLRVPLDYKFQRSGYSRDAGYGLAALVDDMAAKLKTMLKANNEAEATKCYKEFCAKLKAAESNKFLDDYKFKVENDGSSATFDIAWEAGFHEGNDSFETLYDAGVRSNKCMTEIKEDLEGLKRLANSVAKIPFQDTLDSSDVSTKWTDGTWSDGKYHDGTISPKACVRLYIAFCKALRDIVAKEIVMVSCVVRSIEDSMEEVEV